MSKIMVVKNPDSPVSVIHHLNETYKPNKKGEWEIADGDVGWMRTHGLVLREEVEKADKAKASDKAKDDEIAALKARIAELETPKK